MSIDPVQRDAYIKVYELINISMNVIDYYFTILPGFNANSHEKLFYHVGNFYASNYFSNAFFKL